ncbi:hypothetical protein D3C73_816950 [compost metagenome]
MGFPREAVISPVSSFLKALPSAAMALRPGRFRFCVAEKRTSISGVSSSTVFNAGSTPS